MPIYREHPDGIEMIGDDCPVCHLWPRTEQTMYSPHHPACRIGQLTITTTPPPSPKEEEDE